MAGQVSRYISFEQSKIKKYCYEFTGKYAILNPDYEVPFTYLGEKYNSITEAYNILSKPNMTLNEQIRLMYKLVKFRFEAYPEDKEILYKSQGVWFEQMTKDCDNFWHHCTCLECFANGESHNYYGRILMEYRELTHIVSKTFSFTKWFPLYFEVEQKACFL